jgi:hypothetical protein
MSNTHCNEIQMLLPDWIANKERDEHHETITQHLSHCISCKQEANAFEQLLISMKQEQQSAPQQQYFINLLPRIHQRIERKRKQQWYWRIVQIATSLATIVLVMVFGSRFKSSEKTFDEKHQSLTQNISEDDLQDFASLNFEEEDFIFLQQEESLFSTDDSELLQTIVDEQPISPYAISSAFESDEKISWESLSDEDAQTLVSDLEKKFSTNNIRK